MPVLLLLALFLLPLLFVVGFFTSIFHFVRTIFSTTNTRTAHYYSFTMRTPFANYIHIYICIQGVRVSVRRLASGLACFPRIGFLLRQCLADGQPSRGDSVTTKYVTCSFRAVHWPINKFMHDLRRQPSKIYTIHIAVFPNSHCSADWAIFNS